MQVILVPRQEIPNIWAEAVAYLRPAFERVANRTDEVDIYEQLLNGAQDLWIILDDEGEVTGFVATKIYDEPHARVLLFYAGGGQNVLKRADEILPIFESFAKDMGCAMMEIVGRKGWKALEQYGFEEKAVVYEKEII